MQLQDGMLKGFAYDGLIICVNMHQKPDQGMQKSMIELVTLSCLLEWHERRNESPNSYSDTKLTSLRVPGMPTIRVIFQQLAARGWPLVCPCRFAHAHV